MPTSRRRAGPDLDRSVLSMPQNINPGWQATLDGKVLPGAARRRLAAGLGAPGRTGRHGRRPGSRRLACSPGCCSSGPLLARGRASPRSPPLRLRRGPARELPPLRAARVGRLDVVLVVVAAGLPHRLGRARPRSAVTWLVAPPVPGGSAGGLRRRAGAAGRHGRAHVGSPQGPVLVRLLGPGVGDGRLRRQRPRSVSSWLAAGTRGRPGRGGLLPHHPADVLEPQDRLSK